MLPFSVKLFERVAYSDFCHFLSFHAFSLSSNPIRFFVHITALKPLAVSSVTLVRTSGENAALFSSGLPVIPSLFLETRVQAFLPPLCPVFPSLLVSLLPLCWCAHQSRTHPQRDLCSRLLMYLYIPNVELWPDPPSYSRLIYSVVYSASEWDC